MGPFLSIGVWDVVADLCVEFVYVWVRGGRRPDSVSFDNELFGDFNEILYHVRDLSLGDVLFCGVV